MKPLAEIFAQRFSDFLPLATYPVRVGTHFNIAFALRLALDYADEPLADQIYDSACEWFAYDRNGGWFEPSGDEFLSPALCEAVLMHRILSQDHFANWIAAFLPEFLNYCRLPAALAYPATVSDRSDGKIAHLDGLNLSRAWCWRELAPSLPPDAQAMALKVADAHVAASLPHIAGDYMGEHWLATYAALALFGADA